MFITIKHSSEDDYLKNAQGKIYCQLCWYKGRTLCIQQKEVVGCFGLFCLTFNQMHNWIVVAMSKRHYITSERA